MILGEVKDIILHVALTSPLDVWETVGSKNLISHLLNGLMITNMPWPSSLVIMVFIFYIFVICYYLTYIAGGCWQRS